MLVILSPLSVKSDNVRDEIPRALGKQKTVIPILYLDCDIPLRLERHQHIDFRTDHARGLKALLRALGVDQPPQPTAPEPPEAAAERRSSRRVRSDVKEIGTWTAGRCRKHALGRRRQRANVWKLRKRDTLTGHADRVAAVAVTPDGQWAVSGSYDETVKVWELEWASMERRILVGHAGEVSGVAVTPDGQRAVSGSYDQTVKVSGVGERGRVANPHRPRGSSQCRGGDARRAARGLGL